MRRPGRRRPARARPGPQLVGVVANTARTVSLNCRMLANPAAKATSAKGSPVVSISTRAVWARWARARARGPAPTSATQQPLELARAVAQPGGQAGHAVAVDDAVGDQPHGPAHHVAADVPLRRAGRGVGPAPLAGPEPGPLGRRRRGAGSGRSGAIGGRAGQLGRQ